METARSNRIHIGIFGRRNAGKSSLVNAIAGQEVSIVSNVPGTTTDTVWKNIELPGIGAAVIGDTAGYDDEGSVGAMRVEHARRALSRMDIAVLLLSGTPDDAALEREWNKRFEKAGIPVVYVLGKCDAVAKNDVEAWHDAIGCMPLYVSAKTGEGVENLILRIADLCSLDDAPADLTRSIVNNGDVVVLVMPQDAQAPKGRLIQPQVLTLRNLLDKHCVSVCCAPEELSHTLASLAVRPDVIITDSQVFAMVAESVPEGTRLTSFSVLMARYKGDIEAFRAGANALLALPHDGRVLIAEACSHIPQNEDIGRVKLPRLLRRRFGDSITVDIVSGDDFPDDLTPYDVIIHCGACMFTRRHVMARVRSAKAQGVPITNYGVAIAALSGIIDKIEL